MAALLPAAPQRALLELERAYWRACRDQLAGHARLRALTGGGAR